MQQQRVGADVGQDDRVIGRQAFHVSGKAALRLVRRHVGDVEGGSPSAPSTSVRAEVEGHRRNWSKPLYGSRRRPSSRRRAALSSWTCDLLDASWPSGCRAKTRRGLSTSMRSMAASSNAVPLQPRHEMAAGHSRSRSRRSGSASSSGRRPATAAAGRRSPRRSARAIARGILLVGRALHAPGRHSSSPCRSCRIRGRRRARRGSSGSRGRRWLGFMWQSTVCRRSPPSSSTMSSTACAMPEPAGQMHHQRQPGAPLRPRGAAQRLLLVRR